MSINALLEVEIEDKLNKLNEMEPGTDTYKAAVDSITKLLDRAIEMDKFDSEREERLENRKHDEQVRVKAEENEDKKYKIDKIIAVGAIIIPAILTVWGTKASFKFEKEGTITTIMGRGFINKLLPKK